MGLQMAKRPRVSLAAIVAETARVEPQPAGEVIQFEPEPGPVAAVAPRLVEVPPALPVAEPMSPLANAAAPLPDPTPRVEVAPQAAEVAFSVPEPAASNVAVVHLNEILDLKAAEVLREDLIAAKASALHVDASKVQRLGGLCLQVLLSAQRTWAADGEHFRVVDASPDFLEGLRTFGATALVSNA